MNIKNKNLYLRYIPMAVVAVLIIVFAVKNALSPENGQETAIWYLIFKTLPTLITLFVQLLMIYANRYAFLLAGTNAVIYSIVYFIEGIPFSGIFALFISFPLSVYSFFNWKSHSNKGQIPLRHLKLKGIIIMLALTVGGWAICFFWLSKYMVVRIPLLDTAMFSFGIVSTILLATRYIEAQYINVVSNTLSLIMWIALTISNPSNINYAIIGVYNLYCVIQAAVNWTIIGRQNKVEVKT